jgi:Holliday junction DNA helicase RuvA
MIGSLRGSVLERNVDGTVLLEVAGVGYLVVVSSRVLAELEPGTSVFLYIHHHIREDAQMLYGFTSRDERQTFQVLIKTNGVGPALAMAVLATHPPAALFDVVSNNDIAALTLVPGVGKKTAERLLVEMRDKLQDWLGQMDGSGDQAGVGVTLSPATDRVADAESALIALGYKPAEASKAVAAVNDESVGDSEELIRRALKSMVGG